MRVYIYSHTHWDREWYLSQTQFQYRLVRTIDEVVDLIEAGDGFDVFVLDGQTCIIQDYLELRPEREADLRRLIRAGKLAIGPWYSMPDVFLADGESLIRNLARGHADCRDWGASYPNVGYVPDSFGHIEQMPQLLLGVGIDNYVFSRGRPEALAVAQGHRQEFMWQAPEGSRVVAFDVPGGYLGARFLPGPDQPEELRQRFERIVASFAHSHRPDLALAAHGIDHTWLQRDIAAILRALPDLMPDVQFHHGTIEAFLREWKSAPPRDIETWQGQLRGRLRVDELHGTLSSRIDNKLWNARACMYVENLAEPLDALAGRFGKSSARCFLHQAWERICQNHAHDSICGCSQDRVHDAVNSRFLAAAEIGTEVADSALDFLNSDARRRSEPGVIVYAGLNAGQPVVDFVLRLPDRPVGRLSLADADGRLYPVQILAREALRIEHTNATVLCREVRGCVYLPDLQPGEVRRLGVAQGQAGGGSAPEHPVRCAGRVLENGCLRVEVNANGSLDMSDPRTGFRIAETHYFAQEADLGGGYHFEPLAEDVRRDSREGKARVRRLATGPLRGQLEVTGRLRVPARYDRQKRKRVGTAVVTFTSILTLDCDSETLRVSTTIDNQAGNQRIRLVLPTGMPDATIHADASFAVHANSSERWPSDPRQNFHPMRSFVDAAGKAGGLAFFGRGQHEYEIVSRPEGLDLEVTLLRSVDFVFLCSTWETPGAQLRGSLVHDYALRLHRGDWRAGRVAECAASFLSPPIANVNGDSQHPHENLDHATIGFYARRGSVDVPVDTNRSPWHVTNAHRDGWRRIEPDRFVTAAIPTRIIPFDIEGDHVIVSAFKRAEDGRGYILRFWSVAEREQTVTIRGGAPDDVLERVNLLEERAGTSAAQRGPLALAIRPFEIATVRMMCSETTESVSPYPAPAGITASNRYAVRVNGHASFTYLTTGPTEAEFTAGHRASWTSFDMVGPCEVRIRRLENPVREAIVRPLAAGIRPRIEGGEVVLELDRPRKLCVECDGDLTDVLFLFANAPETEVPSPDDPSVVWFGPGVHEIGKYYPLKPATTYYLAPGAFLKGSFAGGGDGTRVIGRGVLSGADYPWPGHLQEKNAERIDLIKLAGDNLELAGITLVDSPYYVVIANGRNNQFHDLKILAWHFNTDGISAGPGARIEDCFLRVGDDAFKPFVSDTRISRCVLWVDRAAAFQLTWNARHDSGGSEVRDCDVIHHMPFCTRPDMWTGAVFWSWHGGTAHIHDLLFEDIRIEGRSPCFINVFMQRNPWSPQDGEWGRFSRLRFRNIVCEQPFLFPSRLLGHDATHPIEDVSIDNLTIAGRRIDSPAAMNLETNPHVPNLRIDGTVVPRVLFAPGAEYADANRCFGIASSIARTPGGRLWCGFSSGGTGEGHLNYGVVVTSDDDGVSWTAPRIVFDTDGDGPIRTDHVTVWTAPSGALWILWSQYPEGLCGPHSSLWCMVSENPDAEQPTWSPPRKLIEGQNLLTTPTVLADGTWIFPTGCWRRAASPSRPLISRDGGKTFELGGPLHADKDPDFDEYMIVERADRGLVIFNRHAESFLQCESSDGGLTWTRQEANGLRHTNSRFVFMKLRSGNWLLVKHGALDTLSGAQEEKFPQNKGRSHLTAFLSCDEGRTWQGGLPLDERECSYPFGCQTDDGTIYVSYERSRWNQPEILMARFREADVMAGRAVSDRASLRVLVNKATGATGGAGRKVEATA